MLNMSKRIWRTWYSRTHTCLSSPHTCGIYTLQCMSFLYPYVIAKNTGCHGCCKVKGNLVSSWRWCSMFSNAVQVNYSATIFNDLSMIRMHYPTYWTLSTQVSKMWMVQTPTLDNGNIVPFTVLQLRNRCDHTVILQFKLIVREKSCTCSFSSTTVNCM